MSSQGTLQKIKSFQSNHPSIPVSTSYQTVQLIIHAGLKGFVSKETKQVAFIL